MTINKRLTLSEKAPTLLHVEAPGCIINIRTGLSCPDGEVTRIDVLADGDRYGNNPQWWIEGQAHHSGMGMRVIKTDTPRPAVKAEQPSPLIEAAPDLLAALQRLMAATQAPFDYRDADEEASAWGMARAAIL